MKHVLRAIWAATRNYHHENLDNGICSIMKPTLWGNLVCKGRFDQQKYPRNNDRKDDTLYWKVREVAAATYLQYQVDADTVDRQNTY